MDIIRKYTQPSGKKEYMQGTHHNTGPQVGW